MKKYGFAYFNKLGGFYGDVFFVREKEEFPAILRQSLFAAERETLEHLKEEDLYLICEFDNESGEVVFCKEFYCAMSPLVEEVIAKRFSKEEVSKDGKGA